MIELFIAGEPCGVIPMLSLTPHTVNMFLRVYGLYGKDKRVLYLVLGVAIPLVAVCAVGFLFHFITIC